jgi:hypothetical protein
MSLILSFLQTNNLFVKLAEKIADPPIMFWKERAEIFI